MSEPRNHASARVGPTRVPRWLIAGCAGVVAACAAWALWPLSSAPIEPPALYAAPRPLPSDVRLALDLDAFRVPIWVAEPPPPPPSVAPARPPPAAPLRLQLLAITREGDRLCAVLYDPDSDRLHVVGDGEVVTGRTVEHVLADAVSFRDSGGRAIQTLSLNPKGLP